MTTHRKSQNFLLLLALISVLVFAIFFGRTLYNTSANHELKSKQVTLTVYANSYFVSQFGPGPEIKSLFEKFCQCTVEYVDVETSILAIEKMKLDPTRRVDVFVGLDHLLLHRAANAIRFQEVDLAHLDWRDEVQSLVYPRFVPYDWAPMGFIYRKSKVSPDLMAAKNLEQAFEAMSQDRLILTDPRMSPVGLEFLYWLFVTDMSFANFSRDLLQQPQMPSELEQNFVQKLRSVKNKVQSYGSSWSASYGVFRQGQADVTWSYLTSLIYHQQVEKSSDYDFLIFDHPHPVQVEYAAVPDSCWNCGGAKQFVEFLTRPEIQKIISAKNYMLPVVKNVIIDSAFASLPKVKTLKNEGVEFFVRYEDQILNLWAQESRK
jgi:thiamine transport system substrate-binding protein